MTGFGKATVQLPMKKITVEIKSLNSKQFDMSARLPQMFRDREPELRNLVASRLERGKVDMVVYIESNSVEAGVTLNLPLMAAYKAQIEDMRRTLNLPEPEDWYNLLLRFPDTMKADVPATVDTEDGEALVQAVNEAVDGLMAFRAQEGARLSSFFATRIDHIRELLSEIPKWENERVGKIRSRIVEGLAKLQIDYDTSRLEQEMIFYIEKLDINEEKQRLTQHLNYFMETMNAPVPGQGKKLGFISQEMGREINTLGSK
ncbi:MAG: YicC family protein, partial [Muribaculaceae bacterium]|nr:YicC family protein [Muribaculaceae bacterium]